MEFYFPATTGEQMAFVGAVATVLLGLFLMLAPRVWMGLTGLSSSEGRRDGASELRSMGGLLAGFGLAALLLAQDFIYFALGAGFALAALGRVLSLVLDGAIGSRKILLLIVYLVLAALPLAYVFQWV
jgi:hypothetical protein